ncbi:TIGR04197 family type VII secretion effector [Virgibacillus sp. YIM 98842]|uniref:TIGR04197 family type VII secretion effector n=1 Tax=Virgibacillus sp. YIM 98842 TaxID=2663533 RepID=UPI0013D9764A|nr:TIGR04197 family type VII secretion effector [Virgibacillus sp. YIM 98842]
MPEVGINFDVFRSNVDNLRSSASNLESSIKTSRTFDKTNISPFIDDLENIIQAAELIDKYKTLLNEDINTLEHVGEQMRQNDEELANRNNYVSHGPQPLRN